jgi:hypothetical protein
MRFVLRHLQIWGRPSSKAGHAWVEVHEPEVRVDGKMLASCLLFTLVALALHLLGDGVGACVLLVVTMLSALSDAVFFNHYYLDLADRVTATIGAVYIGYAATRWLASCESWLDPLVWAKAGSQVATAVTPFTYLDRVRQHPVRSEPWRENHILWHVTGTAAMVFSLLVNEGVLDGCFSALLGHSSLRGWLGGHASAAKALVREQVRLLSWCGGAACM